MTDIQVSDDELQLYFNYLMKNHGVLEVQDFSALIHEDNPAYITDEQLLETL